MVYWPLLAIATHFPASQLDPVSFADTGYDRPAHAACFGLLTVLMLYAQAPNRRPWARLCIAVTGASVYAVVDEFTQGWFGRNVEMNDLAANMVGITLIGVAGWIMPPNTPDDLTDQDVPRSSHPDDPS